MCDPGFDVRAYLDGMISALFDVLVNHQQAVARSKGLLRAPLIESFSCE